jgi:hypothetical protein
VPAPGPTGPVEVPNPSPGAAREPCADLLAALPDEVDPGVSRRPVTGDEALTAAWGDPPVTLQCDVAPPDRPEEEFLVNDVLWSVRDIGPGFRWTTTGREVHVAVEVPDAYANGAELVAPISDAVRGAVPTAAPTAARTP